MPKAAPVPKLKTYTKEELIAAIRVIAGDGWHRSTKDTVDSRNNGAVGNTLEKLLHITENNIPMPDAGEWELKGQRDRTSSLVTLKQMEPWPRDKYVVPRILLPRYGWPHKEAGKKYGVNERSFHSTTRATEFTERGFRIIVDRMQRRLRFIFDAEHADTRQLDVAQWLAKLKEGVGLGAFEIEPYWPFEVLETALTEKITNTFYVIAESKVEDHHEYFRYKRLYVLSGFSFEGYLKCLEHGEAFVDFDATTHHNHGTKFRIRQAAWRNLYTKAERYDLP